MLTHQETQRWAGPDVVIHCPVCYARNVPASTFDQETRDKLYGFIPLNRIQTSWVVCSECRVPLRSRVSVANLEGLEPDRIAEVLFVDPGFIRKALAVIALAVAIVPAVGTVLACVALFANRKFPCWSRMLSWVALVLSLVPPALFAVFAVLSDLGFLK